MKVLRLDQALVARGLVSTRSQAENYIKLGYVQVAGRTVTKPGHAVDGKKITINLEQQYVSRAALKLASVADKFNLDFRKKTVLDVGSSTGGFTDFALRHGALKVIAVDVGADQMHPKLRGDNRVELHEKTDVRDVTKLSSQPNIVLVDVSFISLRDVLPHIKTLCNPSSLIVAMCKPQFEAGLLAMRRASLSSGGASRSAGTSGAESRFSSPVLTRSTSSTTRSVPQRENTFGIQTHRQPEKIMNKGVIKNDTLRRQILNDFETWAKKSFRVAAKADSEILGSKGNQERFYLLQLLG